ncbi:N-(5'-phosphoribosyl)anthranilate isomerase [Neotabrizicola shimadae]|uniref:N-(5'-phosphoribosyl)anthranilate isomerase n=1 Tax=Neotabrizicola shimadae TaxID=2807096 RepID=A0A8G0ZWB6_9RHOB|nr:N-(5'-phosphoribosyl)anthranilate isomerase [Neotabrizicola shimadae]QYZ70610.1 N-(5'-phosphoribosyl)anthranilate isomerase [Neotabrizicola shimadae]
MTMLPAPITPDRWLVQLFTARTVARGGIVRRQVKDVERLVGRDNFLREVHRRGFRVVENAGHFVIFCNTDPVLLLR